MLCNSSFDFSYKNILLIFKYTALYEIILVIPIKEISGINSTVSNGEEQYVFVAVVTDTIGRFPKNHSPFPLLMNDSLSET